LTLSSPLPRPHPDRNNYPLEWDKTVFKAFHMQFSLNPWAWKGTFLKGRKLLLQFSRHREWHYSEPARPHSGCPHTQDLPTYHWLPQACLHLCLWTWLLWLVGGRCAHKGDSWLEEAV
jgi:hypothetical protein